MPCHTALIEARFYEDIADELVRGATAVLEACDASFERFSVPGVLEIPSALAMAVECGRFQGYVLLGCVIRGQTSHYDIVANQSARAIVTLASERQLAVGNGILTVETHEQALVRAAVDKKNKGGDAARAVLALHGLRQTLNSTAP